MILNADQLNLPSKWARKFKNQKVDLVETSEGLLIRPVATDLLGARGTFTRLSTKDHERTNAQEKAADSAKR